MYVVHLLQFSEIDSSLRLISSESKGLEVIWKDCMISLTPVI